MMPIVSKSIDEAPEGDLRLAHQFLKLYNTNRVVIKVLWKLAGESNLNDPFPTLVEACSKISPPLNIYSKDTSVDFHRLLNSALIIYSSSLRQLSQAPRDKKVQKAQSVLHSGRLLSAIVHSTAFGRHITSLVEGELLSLPETGHIMTYRSFAKKMEMSMTEEHKGVIATPASNCAGTDQENAEDQEFTPPNDLTKSEKSILIQNWMKLFVNYFTAKRIMENHSLKAPVDITLLCVTLCEQRYPTWNLFESLIKEILDDGDVKQPDTKKVISEIKQRITQVTAQREPDSARVEPHGIFYTFNKYIIQVDDPKSVKWTYYTTHCEAALAAFATARPEALTDKLFELQKV